MTGYYIMVGSVVLVVTIIGIYDILAERQHRREESRRRLLP